MPLNLLFLSGSRTSTEKGSELGSHMGVCSGDSCKVGIDSGERTGGDRDKALCNGASDVNTLATKK